MQDLHRRNQSMGDMHVVLGCVNSLIACGLVVEPTKNTFKREVIRPPCEVKEKTIATTKEPEVKKLTEPEKLGTTSDGPIYILSTLASRLRGLATDIDSAAISLAEREEKSFEETEKLRQLQALLKSLG